jgi:hypothetical protein
VRDSLKSRKNAFQQPKSVLPGRSKGSPDGTPGTRVAAHPRIAAYLASDRRLAFNEHGIFRHYPELDSES